MARRNLTEHERSTLENGLRVAAERYRENEGELTGPSHMGLPGPQAMVLAQQFARQVREAIDLADVIQGAEEIIVDDGGLMGNQGVHQGPLISGVKQITELVLAAREALDLAESEVEKRGSEDKLYDIKAGPIAERLDKALVPFEEVSRG